MYVKRCKGIFIARKTLDFPLLGRGILIMTKRFRGLPAAGNIEYPESTSHSFIQWLGIFKLSI